MGITNRISHQVLFLLSFLHLLLQIGDIILMGDRGAQVLMLPEHCETVCSSLKQIRSVPVDVDRIDLKDLKVKAQTIKEVSKCAIVDRITTFI